MADNRKGYKILLTDEQKEAIEIFCHMNEWDISFEHLEDTDLVHVENDITPSAGQQNEGSNAAVCARQAPREDIWTDPDAEECAFCYLRPCVTTHRQSWLGGGRDARLANRVTRKTLYKKFWSVMDYRGAWNDPRYLDKKEAAMHEADNQEIVVWIKGPKARESVREIMPECILKLVRNLYPNPHGVPYMGHRWH